MDGGAGGGYLRAGGVVGRARRLGFGTAGFSRARLGAAAVDAAVRDADLGGGHGRFGLVRRARPAAVGLAGHALPAVVRQCVFQPARAGTRGLSGFAFRPCRPAFGGADAGRGHLAAVLAGGNAGAAAVAGRRGVPGVFVLLFRLRAGLAVGRNGIRHGGSGDLPTGYDGVGHRARGRAGVAGVGDNRAGGRGLCLVEPRHRRRRTHRTVAARQSR